MANPDSTSDLLSTLSLDESGVPRSIYDLVIDFGTTFTKAGALRVWPKQDLRARNGSASLGSILNDIVIIDRYPGPHSSKRLSEEAPTTWVYKGKSLIAWGVDLDDRQDDQEVTLALVKLLLDESGRGSVEKQKLKGKLELIGLSVSDVITDYLRSLLRHAAKKIDNIDPSQKLIRIILCIPSIWKPLAQKTMREACQKALFTGMMLREQKDHGLITEPEAVAAFLMEKYPELDVKAGDLIAVLDCGGGTSDVALLDIEQRKPLRMSQVAPVDGAMLGSIFLDEGFEKLLRRRLSHLSNIPRSKLESSVRKAVAEFKHELKTAFEVGDVRDLSIWFGGLLNDPENRITPNRVWFTETEFREIFDPVARGNVKLVVDLYEGYKRNMERENSPIKKLKYLFFVGGLAGSLYMENAVRKAFSYDNILGHAVTVRTPSKHGVTAIVRGAHLLASNVSIVKDVRIPHGYAIVNDEPWRPRIHGKNAKKYKDPHTKRLLTLNRVKVLVQKDDIIQNSDTNSIVQRSGELYFEWNLGQPCDVEVNLWRCSERIEDHADLATRRAAGVIALAYTLKFNLEDVIDARTEWYRVPGEKGIRQVGEHIDQIPAALQRVTRSAVRARAANVDLEAQNGSNTAYNGSTPPTTGSRRRPRSTLDLDDIISLDQYDPDTTESTQASLESGQSVNTGSTNNFDTFFRFTYQVVVRIVGSELTFEIEAPPGGPVLKSTTLDIANVEVEET